ncbi:MAG: hypothetical protein U9N11_04960 [Campylobacterota bacterium]|nr:hypothetical protein [Campylobacterota bacterium]
MTDNSNFLIYQNNSGNIKVDVRFEDESLWLSQTQICEVFGKAKSTISEHIKAIFDEEELDKEAVVRNYRTTANILPQKNQKQLQKLESLKELKEDIKRLK